MSAQSPTTPEGPLVGTDADRLPPLFFVVRHFVSFLKWRFSKFPPGSYRWDPESENTPEQKNSEIFINADTPMDTEVVGKRPAITVLRSQAVYSGLGIGDLAFRDWATGGIARMDLVPTTIMINCLSQEPVEAEAIAGFVTDQVWGFREDIVKTSQGIILYTGARPMISPPCPAGSLVDGSADDWRVVVVSFPTYIQRIVSTLPLNKKILNKIHMDLQAGGPQPKVPDPVSPLQGTAVAQPVQTDLPQQGSDEAQSSELLTQKIQV